MLSLRSTILISLTGLLFLTTGQTVAETKVQKLKINGEEILQYTLIIPDKDDGPAHPLLLALPPGRQNADMVQAGIELYWHEAANRDWIVVSPAAPEGMMFFTGAEKYLPALISEVGGKFKIEGKKVHVAGISNGGRSTFRFALDHPQQVQSMLTIPGMPPEDNDMKHLDRLAGIPIVMYVGAEDKAWADRDRKTSVLLNKLAIRHELHIIPGTGHIMRSISGKTLFDTLDTFRPGRSVEPVRKIKHLQLNEEGVALQGYDPISYFQNNSARKGSSKFAAEYKGATYYFSSAKHRDLFNQDPARYEPAYGGWCAHSMAQGKKVVPDPGSFTVTGGKLYLFHKTRSQNRLDKWEKSPEELRKKADLNWRKINSD